MSSNSGPSSLIAPVTRKRKLQMSVHVASCRGCINNAKCQISDQHGKTLVDEKVCTFTTNALLEDISHSIDILESAATQPTGGSCIHPFVAVGSSSPAVLASAMEMLASQISSESETLVRNPTSHLLRCWRIVASFADALSSGSLAVFYSPLAFCLRRFSPLSPKSRIAGTFCSRKLWQVGNRQFSNAQQNELLCFIIASILAAMRITCLESIISSFATVAKGTSPDAVVDSWRAELSSLNTLLLEAFGFRGPTSVADDFGRFVFVRNTLIEVFLASGQCLILDATRRFPLGAGITQSWICGQRLAALGGNVLEGLAFEAVSFSLLFVNDGVVWSRDVCAGIIARLECDYSAIAGASCSGSAHVPHCLAEALVLHRLGLVIGLVDYRSRFWRLVGGSQSSFEENDFLQWRVADHGVPCSAQLVPKGFRLTNFQHRCLVIARGALCSLFLPDRNRHCCGTNHVDHSCSLDLFSPAVFSAVAMVPLICELLSATQVSAAEWRSIVRAKLESGRRSDSSDSTTRVTRLLTHKIAASLGQDSPCLPQRHAPNSTQESGLLDDAADIESFSYDLTSFFFGQEDSEDNSNATYHSGKLFGVCAFEDAGGDGHYESAMNQGLPVFSQAFFICLACAPQAIAKSVYMSIDVGKDIAPVHYSAQGVRGANVTSFKSPHGGTSDLLLSSPFSSPSTLVPTYFFGWAISASIPSLLAAEEIAETGALSKSKHMTFGSQCVVESLISLQRSIETLNKDLTARGKRSLSLLESDLDALISAKDAEVEFTQISEEHLMAPISFLIGEPFVSPSRKLLTHCCAVQSPFWTIERLVGSPAVASEASAQRNYLRAPNPSFADGIQQRGGHVYGLPLASLANGSCEFFVDYLKNASNVLHTLKGKAFALRHLRSQGQAGSGTLTPHVALVVTDVSLAQLSIFNPIELTRLASACTVSLGSSQSSDQKETDRLFGGHLLTLQKYLPMVRTPEVARTIAAIFLREKSYLLPDTGLLTRIRTELILSWQPDLAHMFRPSFHKAMLLAACALVLKRGLPADVVVWGIIRAYIPSELKEETIYEKGAALVNKCSVA